MTENLKSSQQSLAIITEEPTSSMEITTIRLFEAKNSLFQNNMRKINKANK